jgi:chromosome segregation ATPase
MQELQAQEEQVVEQQPTQPATEQLEEEKEPVMQQAPEQELISEQQVTGTVKEQLEEKEEIIEQPQVAPVAQPEPEKAVTEAEPIEPTNSQPNVEDAEGIDTVDLEDPRGNWLFKRIWWERAERKYEKIRLAVASIFELRMAFFQQRTQLDRDLFDPFYLEIGLTQGELQEVVDELLRKVEKEREKQGALDPQELALVETLRTEKQSLERIRQEVNMINQLDNDVENSLNKLLDQVNRVRNYEREAWNQFKDIARVLSDKKARELYHAMDVTWQNIKDIREYIEQPFTQHFNQVVSTARQQVEAIQNEMQELKDKGVDLQLEAEKLVAAYSAQLEKPTHAESDEGEDEQEVESTGFVSSIFATIGNGMSAVWDAIVSVITWPFTKLFGQSEAYEADEDDEESEQVAYNQEAELPDLEKEFL